MPNRAPRTVGTIADRVVELNNSLSLDIGPYFSDPDGDALTYTASSSDTDIVTAAISGTNVVLDGEGEGEATVTVTATDPGGLSATQSIDVTVDRAPVVDNPIEDIEDATPNEIYATYLPDVFSDPDDDQLTWTATSSDDTVAETEISGDTIIVTAVAVGSATVSVTATDPGGLSATDTFEVTVVAARFDHDLYFAADVRERYRGPIRKASASWEAILKDTELEDITYPKPHDRCVKALGQDSTVTVDDHAVVVGVREIDGSGGVLATASFCHTRQSDSTIIISVVWFDEDDIYRMETTGRLEDLAMHEFAHGLGFNYLHWNTRDVVDTVGSDPHFTGELAIEAFDSAGGDDYDGEKVPISSDYSHWRSSVFGDELMTPSLGSSNPVSAITLQAMADIRFVVDTSLADDYELPEGEGEGEGEAKHAQGYDLSGDVVIGPVSVVDSEGGIVRVIPPPAGVVPRWLTHWDVRIDRDVENRPGAWVRR